MKLDNPCMNAMRNFRRLIKYSKSENRVKFEAILPLELRNRVSGKGQKSQKGGCFQEMSIALSCLKANEFNQTNCSNEIKAFVACADQRRSDKYIRKQEFHKKELTVGNKDLKDWEVNELLKMYPQL